MLGTKMSNFDHKIWIFVAKSQFQESVLESRFFSPVHHRRQLSRRTHPKKFCFRGLGHFPGLIPNFGHFWGLALLAIFGVQRDRWATTLSFNPRMTKLAPNFNFPKIFMVIEDSWGPAISDRETADFPKIKYPTKLLKCPKIVFFLWK